MRAIILACIFLSVADASARNSPGNYSGHVRTEYGVSVMADSSTLRFIFYAPDVLRIDFLPAGQSAMDSSLAVIQAPSSRMSISVDEAESSLTVTSSWVRATCRKYPLRLSFSDPAGQVFLAEPASGGMSRNDKERTMRFLLQKDDHFYGTGERGTGLDKRGQRLESYNTQVGGYSTPLATMNLNVPFVATTNGYALYVDNTYRGEWDFGNADTTVFSYTAAGGELSWYLIAAPSIPEQLARYTWLTGRQPLPPRWAFGFIQSKNRYENEEEARSIVTTMRAKQIPCDAIVLDLGWFDNMGDLTWNKSSWPHHESMVSDFLSTGMKTILITEPYIIQPSHNFAEAEENGYLAWDSSGHTVLLEKWWSCRGECSASLLDLTNPEAQRWWWSKHPPVFGASVAGIWTDLGEPERHPASMVHHLGEAGKIHNVYNLLWAKTIFEGFNSLRPGERTMNITRSGFAGIQRYGVLPWSGDVARSFGGLSVQLPMVLNMGMSGLAYHHSDIGGYARMTTTPELYVRWMQYGTFCPIARAHGAGETVRGSPTEPWQFGPEAERICRDFLRLRYRLLPYIYTLAYRNFASGLPLARPLLWLDPADPALLNESSSYMWGDAFLVSPVVAAGQSTRDLYLPRGLWVDFWTDEVIRGGTTVSVPTPLDRMPLFVKAGSIIPMAPEMDFSDQRPIDTLTLRVYPAEGPVSSYSLYEDDGKTTGYQRGEYALTTFSQEYVREGGSMTLTLSAGVSEGQYAGQPATRTYVFEVHGIPAPPSDVQRDGRSLEEGLAYDQTHQKLVVIANCRADESCRMVIRFPIPSPPD